MIQCSKCGNQMPDSTRFCDKCGTPVPAGTVPTPTAAPVAAAPVAPAASGLAGLLQGRLALKAILLAALLCFFLPFVTVSCNYEGETHELDTMSGVNLLFGKEYESDEDIGDDTYGGKFNFYLWASFGLTIASLVLVCKNKKKVTWLLSGAGAFFLLIFRFSFKSMYELDASEIKDYLDIDFRIGFWLAMLLMIGATALCWFEEAQEKLPGAPAPQPVGTTPPPMGGAPTQPGMDLSQCGGNPQQRTVMEPVAPAQPTASGPIDLSKKD